MLEGLAGLVMAAEVARAEIQVQTVADAYFSQQQYDTPNAVIKYEILSEGEINSDFEEFEETVTSILNDVRGWKRAGVGFERAEEGETASMKIILAAPSVVGSYAGCSDTLSCRYGERVMINDDRWANGSESYTELGVTIDEYREMVVNHEVGHFLGHGHIQICESGTGIAPVMLQQSTGLNGCTPNSWPLPSELWVNLN